MRPKHKLSDREVLKAIKEIRTARTAAKVRYTSQGGTYVRPIDIIVSDSNEKIINPPEAHKNGRTTNGNGKAKAAGLKKTG